MAGHYIPYMVRKFLQQKKNEGITFGFYQLHTDALIEGLKNDRFDIIFGSYVDHEPEIQFIPIINQEMVIITPPDHPLTAQKEVHLRDLTRWPIIGYDRTSVGWENIHLPIPNLFNPFIDYFPETSTFFFCYPPVGSF